MAGAEAQKRPAFTSTLVQIAIYIPSPHARIREIATGVEEE
jgi:hypothetical protein